MSDTTVFILLLNVSVPLWLIAYHIKEINKKKK